jgi:copper transport protein
MHLYLFDRTTGAQFGGAKELTIRATQPDRDIGLDLHAQKAGPGHYVVQAAPLTAPGTWRLDVTMRVSDFDEFTTRAEVPIR